MFKGNAIENIVPKLFRIFLRASAVRSLKCNKPNVINLTHRFVTTSRLHLLYGLYHKLLKYKTAPILVYHTIGESSVSRFNLSLKAFTRQIDFLALNFRCIQLREILKELSLPRPVSDVIPVAITFDDGYRNLITHAHPIMEKYHIPYTVFVPTGFIGGLASWRRDNHLPLLTDQELLELKRTGLVDFGSHTVHHCSMASLSEEEMTKEARLSKNHLSELLQDDSVDMFAYPHGGPSDVSNQTARILRKIGYNLAVTNRSGSMNSYRRRLALRRITFYEGDDERIMLAKLSGEYDWYYLKELVANFARKLVFA